MGFRFLRDARALQAAGILATSNQAYRNVT